MKVHGCSEGGNADGWSDRRRCEEYGEADDPMWKYLKGVAE